MTPTRKDVEPTTSATDELREGLRKRGESWLKWPDDDSTTWQAYSNPHTATESMDGTLIVTGLTPAQAIAATLERGTCHIVKASRKYVLSDGTELFENGCSVCNGYIGEGDNFCPNCGRKVVDE